MGRCSDARDRLLLTAARLIHERGYTAVSVADICEAAGLKKGSFYHFFPSKQALVLETLERFAEHNRDNFRRLAATVGTARDKVAAMFEGLYQTYQRRKAECDGRMLGCPIGNLALEMAHRDPDIRAKLESIFGEWKRELSRLLGEADASGELRVPDPDAVAESLVAFAEGATLLAKTMSDPEVFRRATAHALALLAPEPSPADTAAT